MNENSATTLDIVTLEGLILIAVGLLILFQLGFTYLPTMQALFGTTYIDADMWLCIILVASSVLFLVELEKIAALRVNKFLGIRTK